MLPAEGDVQAAAVPLEAAQLILIFRLIGMPVHDAGTGIILVDVKVRDGFKHFSGAKTALKVLAHGVHPTKTRRHKKRL